MFQGHHPWNKEVKALAAFQLNEFFIIPYEMLSSVFFFLFFFLFFFKVLSFILNSRSKRLSRTDEVQRRVRHMAPQITAQSHRWHLKWDLQVISQSGESLAYETCPLYVFIQFMWHSSGSCAPLIHRSWVWLLWAIPELSASCSKHPIDEHSHYRSALF